MQETIILTMPKKPKEFDTKALTQRINRIIGQLNGIAKMVKEKRDFQSVLQQVSAVKKAIDSLSKEIVLSDLMDYIPPIKQRAVKRLIESALSP